jgi:hypothetical protein
MESLAEAVQRRVHFYTGPQQLKDLLAMQGMLGARGQQLRQRLGASALPIRYRDRLPSPFDLKAAEKAHIERGHGVHAARPSRSLRLGQLSAPPDAARRLPHGSLARRK